MDQPSDPAIHQQREQRFLAHVQQLLQDDQFRVETSAGLKSVTLFARQVTAGDDAVAVKRKMIDLGLFDRDLQRSMPTGLTLDVTLAQPTFFGGHKVVGRIRVVSLSPTDDLLKCRPPAPADAAEVTKVLASQPPPVGGAPQTVLVVATGGLTDEARALAGRDRSGRTVVLVEANDKGGWTVAAPPALADWPGLLDPEVDADKRQRVIDEIAASPSLLTGGSLAASAIAAKLNLPAAIVDRAFRDHAAATPGLAARPFEGTLLLYREGLSSSADPTGDAMPFWEKVKGAFGMGEGRAKRVAKLSQERAALTFQRERAYTEFEAVDKKEAELTATFPAASPMAQKRIATEIAQLRKRSERVQQLVSTIDKKINIVETGVHNLEMEQHLSKKKLETLEEVAQASEQVDIGMATLDQLSEQADAVSVAGSEMSGGAQDVLAELQAKFAEKPAPAEKATDGPTSAADRAPAQRDRAATTNGPPAIPAERRRNPGAAEPG